MQNGMVWNVAFSLPRSCILFYLFIYFLGSVVKYTGRDGVSHNPARKSQEGHNTARSLLLNYFKLLILVYIILFVRESLLMEYAAPQFSLVHSISMVTPSP